MSNECLQDTDSGRVDGLWDSMREEERAARLTQVAQDAARDAKLADALVAAANERRTP